MAIITSKEAREKLTKTSAKEAFDKLDALGPRWVCIEEEQDKVYLSPSIETKTIGGGILSGVGRGWAKSFDEAAVNQLEALQEKAEKANTLIVVNAYQDNRAEYTYHSDTRTFVPYKPA